MISLDCLPTKRFQKVTIMFDEEPHPDPHGDCDYTIHLLEDRIDEALSLLNTLLFMIGDGDYVTAHELKTIRATLQGTR